MTYKVKHTCTINLSGGKNKRKKRKKNNKTKRRKSNGKGRKRRKTIKRSIAHSIILNHIRKGI
jgi:hypothetical protein